MEIFDYERWRLHLDSNYISKEIHLVFYCLFSPCILCTRNMQGLEYFISGDFQKAVCSVRPISYIDFYNTMSIKGNNWNILFFKTPPINAGTAPWSRQTPSNSEEFTYRKSSEVFSVWKVLQLQLKSREFHFCHHQSWSHLLHWGLSPVCMQAVGHRCPRLQPRAAGGILWPGENQLQDEDCACFNDTKLEPDWACLLANHAYILQSAF